MERFKVKSCLFVTVLTSCLFRDVISLYSTSHESGLRQQLLQLYEPGVRPNGTVQVTLDFQLTDIIEVNLKGQYISFSGWWDLSWTDSRLTWNAKDYGNIGLTTFYQNQIWHPALVVSNSLADLSAIDEETIPMRVESNGAVSWNPTGIVKVGCEMDTTYFPFDQQTCSIEVTSFGYTQHEVFMSVDKGVLRNYYTEDGDWDLLGTATSTRIYFDKTLDYVKITYSITIERRSNYYWLNTVVPVIVNGFLTIFIFLLPAESGEKMGYSLTVLLTYVVLMTLMADEMPTSAKHTPLLQVYICLILGSSAVGVVVAIANLAIYYTDQDTPVSYGLQKMTRTMMWLCGYPIQRCNNGNSDNSRRNGMIDAGDRAGSEEMTLDKRSTIRKVYPSDAFAARNGMYNLGTSNPRKGNIVSLIDNEIRSHDKGEGLPDNASSTSDEDVVITWKLVSSVMDSMCIRIYTTLVITLTIVFLTVLLIGP